MKVPGQLTISTKDDKAGLLGSCAQPPEFRVVQTTAEGTQADGMNEGWRFAVAYGAVCVFCIVHHLLQRMGCLSPAIMDNGVNPHFVTPDSPSLQKSAESKTAASSASGGGHHLGGSFGDGSTSQSI